MSNSSNTQQSKLILKKTAYSLILGVISVILPLILIWYGVNFVPGRVFLLVMLIAGACAIVGLIFGIKGLKSTRRRLAIVGIAICLISLLFWMYLSLGWLTWGGLTELDLL